MLALAELALVRILDPVSGLEGDAVVVGEVDRLVEAGRCPNAHRLDQGGIASRRRVR